MNDFAEGQIAIRHAMSHLRAAAPSSPLPPEQSSSFRRWLLPFIQAGMEVDTFVLSLTPAPDDLSQWIHYGDSGGGVALGVKADALSFKPDPDPKEVEAGEWQPFLAPVVYDPKVQREIIITWLNEMESRLAACSDHPWRVRPDREFPLGFSSTMSGFATLSALFKHPGFAMEHEWRLIGSVPRVYASRLSTIGVKPRSRGIAPYLTVQSGQQTSPFPLKAIITGPTTPVGTEYVLSLVLNRLGWSVQGQFMSAVVGPEKGEPDKNGRYVVYLSRSSVPYRK